MKYLRYEQNLKFAKTYENELFSYMWNWNKLNSSNLWGAVGYDPSWSVWILSKILFKNRI